MYPMGRPSYTIRYGSVGSRPSMHGTYVSSTCGYVDPSAHHRATCGALSQRCISGRSEVLSLSKHILLGFITDSGEGLVASVRRGPGVGSRESKKPRSPPHVRRRTDRPDYSVSTWQGQRRVLLRLLPRPRHSGTCKSGATDREVASLQAARSSTAFPYSPLPTPYSRRFAEDASLSQTALVTAPLDRVVQLSSGAGAQDRAVGEDDGGEVLAQKLFGGAFRPRRVDADELAYADP